MSHRPIPIKQLPAVKESVSYRLTNLSISRLITPQVRPAAPPIPKAMRPQLIPQQIKANSGPRVSYVQPRPLPSQWTDRVRRLAGSGRGRILVIVGNGPSTAEVPLQRLRPHPLIDLMSINHPDPRVWPTKYWAFCDLSQYRRHTEQWDKFPGTIITSSGIGLSKEVNGSTKTNVVYLRNLGGLGFSRDLLDGVYVGRSTVFANMQSALWMGYDKVYIFGCDMAASGDGRVWSYGLNPDVRPDDRLKRFELDAEYYNHAANLLGPDERARYVFCSSYNPWPFVAKYQRLPHETAVDTILANSGA